MSENSSKERVAQEIEAERQLIKKVFDNPDGHKLLQKWAATHIWANQLHKDPHILYARIGQHVFVTNILNNIGDK
jgi:hypothetical protein